MTHQTYILDTCVFNRLLDEKIRLDDISPDGPFAATHVQFDELKATPTRHGKRRDELIAAFNEVAPLLGPTESFCFDVSHFDSAKVE